MAQVLAEVALGFVLGELISAGANSLIHSSTTRSRQGRVENYSRTEEIIRSINRHQQAVYARTPIVEELESEDRSILQNLPKEEIECKLCMNITARDYLCLRTCKTATNDTANVFACIQEHPICYDCSEKLRKGQENRCPFCRQHNVFRKPRHAHRQEHERQSLQGEAGRTSNRHGDSATQFWVVGPRTTERESWQPTTMYVYDLERQLTRFYSMFNPEYIPRAREIAAQFAGREGELRERLQRKYGHDLYSGERGGQEGEQLSARLRHFYARYNPRQERFAEEVAADFAGREPELNAALRLKYGVDLASNDCL